MCLYRKKEFEVRTKYGYKVFYEIDGKLYAEFAGTATRYAGLNAKGYQEGVWLKEEDYRINSFFSGILYENKNENKNGKCFYPFGFHVFKTRRSANMWRRKFKGFVIRKIEYREIVAKGEQRHFRRGYKYPEVFVVKEMKILKMEIF